MEECELWRVKEERLLVSGWLRARGGNTAGAWKAVVPIAAIAAVAAA